MVRADALGHLLHELLLAGDGALAEHLVPGLLVGFGGLEGLDVHDGEGEDRVELGELRLVHLEHRGAVGLVLEGHAHVTGELVAGLLADEQRTGDLGDVGDGDVHAFGAVGLVRDVGDDVVVLAGLFALLEGTVLLEHLGLHRLLGVLGDIDLVVRDLVALAGLEVQFRGLGDVELEGEVGAGLPLQLRLVLGREGLADDADLLVADEGVELLGDEPVHGLIEGLVAIEALDQGHRGHSLAETLDVGAAAVFFQSGGEGLGVVVRGDVDGDLVVQGIGLVLGNVHCIVWF